MISKMVSSFHQIFVYCMHVEEIIAIGKANVSFNCIVFSSRKWFLGNSVYQCCKNVKYSFMLNPFNLELSQQKDSTADFEGRVKKQTGVTFLYNHTHFQ